MKGTGGKRPSVITVQGDVFKTIPSWELDKFALSELEHLHKQVEGAMKQKRAALQKTLKKKRR